MDNKLTERERWLIVQAFIAALEFKQTGSYRGANTAAIEWLQSRAGNGFTVEEGLAEDCERYFARDGYAYQTPEDRPEWA